MKKILNILLIVLMAVTFLLTVYAVAAGPEALNAAINLNLIWGYILFGVAILSALGCAVMGMAKNPAGIKSSILSLVLVVVVIGASYFIANGHDVKIVDLQNGGFFDGWKAVIAETGILVSYVAAAGAILAAVYSEIANALK